MIVSCIVEGDGEVAALPVLLRRLTDHFGAGKWIDIPLPIRVKRDRFLNRDGEFERFLLLAATKAGDGRVLVLLDADDDCPVELARSISERASALIDPDRLAVVIAVREFEGWFIAAADHLDGTRGFRFAGNLPVDPENIRGAKEWLSERIDAGRYHEVADQPAFCARLRIDVAEDRSRSFRKLCDEWRLIVEAT